MAKIFQNVSVFMICLALSTGCQNIKSSLVKTDNASAKSVTSSGAAEKIKQDTLAKSQSLMPDSTVKSSTSSLSKGVYTTSPVVDDPQKLLSQYVDMDRLGNAVLFEIDLAEKKWAATYRQYRQASPSEQEKLKDQLERADSDRLILYRAYARIYRDGKTDWATVQRDVQNTLNSLKSK